MSIGISFLLEEIAKGNHSAFEELYNAYFKKSYSLAWYFVKSKESVEDIVAEVFLTIWKNRDTLPQINDWDSYLYVTIRNQAFAYLKQTKKMPAGSSDFISIEFFSENNNPEEQLLKQEFDIILNKALNELPDRCKMIYYLVREEKQSYKQISAALNISERTINTQMTIATKRLGICIKEYLEIKNKK